MSREKPAAGNEKRCVPPANEGHFPSVPATIYTLPYGRMRAHGLYIYINGEWNSNRMIGILRNVFPLQKKTTRSVRIRRARSTIRGFQPVLNNKQSSSPSPLSFSESSRFTRRSSVGGGERAFYSTSVVVGRSAVFVIDRRPKPGRNVFEKISSNRTRRNTHIPGDTATEAGHVLVGDRKPPTKSIRFKYKNRKIQSNTRKRSFTILSGKAFRV